MRIERGIMNNSNSINVGNVIATYRKENGLSQIDLAAKLEAFDIHIGNAAISTWEKGINMPTALQLLAVCQILHIYDIYTAFIEKNPEDPFAELNEEGVQLAHDYIELLKRSGKYDKSATEIITLHPRKMPIALLATSAGTGNYIDEENFEEIDIYDPVPEKASFGVYLDGDSMEPVFQNGELIWIEATESLDSGDIGLFFLDGKTYFKKFVQKETGTFLVSLNAKYQPIPVKNSDNFKVFGKLALD